MAETINPQQATILRSRRDELARKHGAWCENVYLGAGIYTRDEIPFDEGRRERAIVQVAADALGRDLADARVLDGGAGEGSFAVEFARHGAEVVAVEGRAGNAEKARFLKEALGLDRLTIIEQDIRRCSRDSLGQFDVVLCLGLLYHLDAPSAIRVLHELSELSRRIAVVDTEIALAPRDRFSVGSRTYHGRLVREFDRAASASEQEALSRSALGNPESFWLSRPSLLNLLAEAGFTSVLEAQVPHYRKTADRVTLVAFRGEPRAILTSPIAQGLSPTLWPERERRTRHPVGTFRGTLRLKLAPHLPKALKEFARRRRPRA